MLSDMVGRGLFHRLIMTSGGTTRRPVRSVQLENESTLPAMPKTNAANTQSTIVMGLIESNSIFPV